MISKTYKDLIQEFHYFKEESKLDSNSKERINRLEKILTSTMDYYSTIDNKYIEDVKNSLITKINSNLNACIINKKRILSEMDNYSLNFGNIKLDEMEYRINEYNNLLKELDKLYIEILIDETNYNNQDIINLYNECIDSINNNKDNTDFLGSSLHNYSNDNYQIKLISKLYSYISNKEFISTFSYIIKLKNSIADDRKNITKLNFIKKNKKYIELYDSMSNSSSLDLNYIIEKSYVCDDLKSKLNDREKNKLLRKKVFNIFYTRILKNLDNEEKDIDKRHKEYKKKENYLSKLSCYFKKNEISMDEIINSIWLDSDMIDNKINNYKNDIKEKELLLEDSINKLSNEDRELYDNHYISIENIITSLCNKPSNMINIYILYILSNIDNIISNNKKECYNDYKTNNIVAEYKNKCTNRIIEIDSHNSIQKIKTR